MTLEDDNKKFQVIRGDGFVMSYYAYHEQEGGKKISGYLNKKTAQIGDFDTTYRVVNHWSSLGLIDDNREEHRGWRRFSIVETFWLRIMLALREFGFPLEKIMETKKDLFKTLDKTAKCPLLEFYIVKAIFHKEDAVVLVFPNGSAEIATSDELSMTDIFAEIPSHITIALSTILKKLFPNKEIKSFYDLSPTLTAKEQSLLFDIRLNRFDEVKIKLKNGEIERIDGTENVEAGEQTFDKVRELIKNGDYQDIQLKQQGGKIVSIKRTLKKKP